MRQTLLRRIEVKNLALIREMDLEFEDGLNLITGETGAGKSILLDAFGLALGFKAGADLVRSGEAMARVQVLFELDKATQKTWNTWLEAKGLPESFGDLWLKRELASTGRSRAWINGESVPLATLAEAGDLLVDFHGQHEHQSLLKSSFHGALLDESAELGPTLGLVKKSYEALASAKKLRDGVSLSEDERIKRVDFLQYQLRELEEAALKPGERARLIEERGLGLSAGRRSETLASLHQVFFGAEAEGALHLLGQAESDLLRLAGMDKNWANDLARLKSSLLELRDLAEKIEFAKDKAEHDPVRAEAVELRLHLLERLGKKYGGDESFLLEQLDRIKMELDSLQHHEAKRAELEASLAKAQVAYAKNAVDLSAKRRLAAKAMEKAVTRELGDLGMDKAVFEVRLSERGEPSATGLDDVEFLLAANLGEAPRPLSKVASGGELSRITLALKSALVRGGTATTLVFDEIDSGISGRIAEIVGEKISRLSHQQQLLCVTHLPQIASRPARHLRVNKRVAPGGMAETNVDLLNAAEREKEVATLLAGKALTPSAMNHARELLSLAKGSAP
jgi:DNA repair protein RecN (Recombination protein N)